MKHIALCNFRNSDPNNTHEKSILPSYLIDGSSISFNDSAFAIFYYENNFRNEGVSRKYPRFKI